MSHCEEQSTYFPVILPASVWPSTQCHQITQDLRRSPVWPPAQNRLSHQVRSGCSWFYLVRAGNLPVKGAATTPGPCPHCLHGESLPPISHLSDPAQPSPQSCPQPHRHRCQGSAYLAQGCMVLLPQLCGGLFGPFLPLVLAHLNGTSGLGGVLSSCQQWQSSLEPAGVC